MGEKRAVSLFALAYVRDATYSSCNTLQDFVVAVLLLYTATVTPFEVSFLIGVQGENFKFDTLFFINRIVDLGYALDIVVQFHLAYINMHGRIVTDLQRIRSRYMKGQFLRDVVICVPYDMLELVTTSGMTNIASLRMLRCLRLLRLLKMLKLMRMSDVAKRWEAELHVSFAVQVGWTLTPSKQLAFMFNPLSIPRRVCACR